MAPMVNFLPDFMTKKTTSILPISIWSLFFTIHSIDLAVWIQHFHHVTVFQIPEKG